MKLADSQKGTLQRPHEFAKAAGVTVQALHYYDRLGLLKPSGRTGAGFRLYGEGDVAQLQHFYKQVPPGTEGFAAFGIATESDAAVSGAMDEWLRALPGKE